MIIIILDADEVEGNLMSKILQISHYFQNFLYEMDCQQFCMIIIILDANEVEGNLMSKILLILRSVFRGLHRKLLMDGLHTCISSNWTKFDSPEPKPMR